MAASCAPRTLSAAEPPTADGSETQSVRIGLALRLNVIPDFEINELACLSRRAVIGPDRHAFSDDWREETDSCWMNC